MPLHWSIVYVTYNDIGAHPQRVCVGNKGGARNVPLRLTVDIRPPGRVSSRNEKRCACVLCRLFLTRRDQTSPSTKSIQG